MSVTKPRYDRTLHAPSVGIIINFPSPERAERGYLDPEPQANNLLLGVMRYYHGPCRVAVSMAIALWHTWLHHVGMSHKHVAAVWRMLRLLPTPNRLRGVCYHIYKLTQMPTYLGRQVGTYRGVLSH